MSKAKAEVDRMREYFAAREGGRVVTRPGSSPPELWPGNQSVWDLFEMAQSQAIPGPMGGIVGLTHTSVSWYMDLMELPTDVRRDAFELFRIVENLYVRHCNRNLKKAGGDGEGPGNHSSRAR